MGGGFGGGGGCCGCCLKWGEGERMVIGFEFSEAFGGRFFWLWVGLGWGVGW